MTLLLDRSRAGAYARSLGYRREGGFRRWLPRRLRGLASRRKLTFSGGNLCLAAGARIIRVPGSRIILGTRVLIDEQVIIRVESADAELRIGSNSYVNRRSEICCTHKISIGSGCAISWDVRIADSDYHRISPGSAVSAPISIGDDVWIGAGAMVLKGVEIGDGCVIGAGSVVVTSIPARSLAVGVPARVVRSGVTWER